MQYDYKCTNCGEIVTKIRRMSEYRDPCECPSCGSNCEKVILRPPIVSLDPISGHHVGATSKWLKHREQVIAKERHNKKEHGESGLKPR